MASNSQGIQQLLAAEKAAAEKVSAARKREYSFEIVYTSMHACTLFVSLTLSDSLPGVEF